MQKTLTLLNHVYHIIRALPVGNIRQRLFVTCLIAITLAISVIPAAAIKTTAPEKIKIIVGGEIGYPPYSFLDKNGNPTGFAVELTRAIAKTMGMNVENRLSPWPETRKALEDGTIDIIPGMFYSEERAKIFDFSPPFAIVSDAIFARLNSPSIKSLEDLRNKEIIVMRGEVMRGEVMHDYILKHHLTDRLLLTETPADALRLLASGKGDYALVAQMPGLYWIKELKLSNITSVGHSLEPFKNCFAVRKGNNLLLSRFTEGLNILNQTGEYQKLYDKWLSVLEPTRITLGLAVKYAAIVFIPLTLLLIGSLLWTWMLRTKVNQKIKDLKESESKYRFMNDNVADIIWTVDMNLNFTYISPSVQKVRGLTVEDAMSQKINEVLTPASLQNVLRAMEESNKALINNPEHITEKLTIELEEYCKNGSTIWTENELKYLPGENGKPIGIIGVTRDISARKHAEEEKQILEERLSRAEKMEALGTMAGGVAHDLNNVLGIVVGYAELTLDSLDKQSPLRNRLENVVSGGLKAAAIVDDMLTLARRGVPGRSIINLNEIIADCQGSPELSNLSFHHPAVTIKTNLESALLNISGSSVHLGKSLYNLVSNAAEAMPKGGTLTISTTNRYLDKPISGYDKIHAGDYVVLSVSDEGEGISESDLKRIFEPFYTKKIMGRSGTGLGLAVVWSTVKDHNGYINVLSEEGKGSTFTLYFPVTNEETPAQGHEISISGYMGNGESILIVDDVKEQRDLAAGMLTSLNYNVSIVASGEEAVTYLKEHQADLIVLDMIMDPGMDGLDTYKSVLKIHPKQKAIIVSGFSESDRVKTAKGLGAGAYIRKPYIKEILGMAVRKELDRSISSQVVLFN